MIQASLYFEKINDTKGQVWIAYSHLPPMSATPQEPYQTQKINVRQLLNQLLNYLQIDDDLDERQFPYRLKKTGYFICFSHSGHSHAVMLSTTHAVGVDIEQRDISWQVARRFYHPNDIEILAKLSPKIRQVICNQLWQIKECLIKVNQTNLMTGLGMDMSAMIASLIESNDQDSPMITLNDTHQTIFNNNLSTIYMDHKYQLIAIY